MIRRCDRAFQASLDQLERSFERDQRRFQFMARHGEKEVFLPFGFFLGGQI